MKLIRRDPPPSFPVIIGATCVAWATTAEWAEHLRMAYAAWDWAEVGT